MSGDKAATPKGNSGYRSMLEKYEMDMSEDGFMGEGSFCSCRRAKCLTTGALVAIKFFKETSRKGSVDSRTTCMRKFRRQISVMKALAKPFQKPESERLWTGALENVDPTNLFVQLVDYSQDVDGNPAVDSDGGLFIVLELAQYSLRDFIRTRNRKRQYLSKESALYITKAILCMVAGLHAHGYVHLDLKPENMMFFDGWLKLIDLDGCVKKGTKIEVDDATISFSPCYCAPEWASWLVDSGHAPAIIASPGLDSWSVGCTLCELVTLEALMKKRYAGFLRQTRSQQEAGIFYLEWLANRKVSPVTSAMQEKDSALVALITDCLLVCEKDRRWTCAESLNHKYFSSGHNVVRSNSCPVMYLPDAGESIQISGSLLRKATDYTAHSYKGLLWKVNAGKDPRDATEWLQHDMWIASNMSLCYYNLQEQKSFVLLDASKLYTGVIMLLDDVAREFAFQIKVPCDETDNDGEDSSVGEQTFVFAAASAQELNEWTFHLNAASQMDYIPTLHLGSSAARDLQAYKVTVKNRRLRIDSGDLEKSGNGPFDAAFKSYLWKVKGGGDRMQANDWFLREYWLSRNNCLIYWSPKEKCELIYYTAFDILRAEFKKIPNESSLKPWTFQVRLPPSDGTEFAPGEFAAESKELRDQWLDVLRGARSTSHEWCQEYTSACENALKVCCSSSFKLFGTTSR